MDTESEAVEEALKAAFEATLRGRQTIRTERVNFLGFLFNFCAPAQIPRLTQRLKQRVVREVNTCGVERTK